MTSFAPAPQPLRFDTISPSTPQHWRMIAPPPTLVVAAATSLPQDRCSDAVAASASASSSVAAALLGLRSQCHSSGGSIENGRHRSAPQSPSGGDDDTYDVGPNSNNDDPERAQQPECRTFLASSASVQDQSSMECRREDDVVNNNDDGADGGACGDEGRRMELDRDGIDGGITDMDMDIDDDLPELELDAETLRDLEAFFRTHADFRKRVEREMEVEIRKQH